MKTLRSGYYVLLIALILFIAASCSPGEQIGPSTEDMRYLTPIPQATIDAYSGTEPIADKMQAVLAARKYLLTTRLWFANPPQVVFADELTYKEAAEWVRKTGEFNPDEELTEVKVWLVMLEGISEVIPPGTPNTSTPGPGALGCAYVILDADGYSSVTYHTGVSCPRAK